MATVKKLCVQEQVKNALDGRSQRWLAMEIKMPEDTLSRKMNGYKEFTQDEVDTINKRLNVNIVL